MHVNSLSAPLCVAQSDWFSRSAEWPRLCPPFLLAACKTKCIPKQWQVNIHRWQRHPTPCADKSDRQYSRPQRCLSHVHCHLIIIFSYTWYLLCLCVVDKKSLRRPAHTGDVISFSAPQVSSWCGGRVSWWHEWSVWGHDNWRGPRCSSPASGHPAQPRPFPHPAHQTQRAQRTPRQVVTTATTRLRTRPPPCDRWESVIQQNCKSETVNEWTSNQLPRAPPESGFTDRLHRLVFQIGFSVFRSVLLLFF